MNGKAIRSFGGDERGAIAPMFALALFGLVAIAAVGFDYGRMAAMDSELQNAADQAALAAVTQLNGQDDAINKAKNAATEYFATADSAFVNETRFSNRDDDGDGDTRPITQLNFAFYQGYNYINDTPTGLIAEADYGVYGSRATVVQVTVQGREVFYALTPIVAAFSSGPIQARAMATLQQAACNVAPMMFCAPSSDFGAGEADQGVGMRFRMLPNSIDPATTSLPAGNFGFLDINYGTKGKPVYRLGMQSAAFGCIGGIIGSDPGNQENEIPAFNTRFDIRQGNASGLKCNPTTGDYCAATNVRSNRVRIEENNSQACQPNLPGNANKGWVFRDKAGFPMEDCFTNGSGCVFGNGDWNRTGYMNLNHATLSAEERAQVGSDWTRYEVYKWEMEEADRRAPTNVDPKPPVIGKNGKETYTNSCSYPNPADNKDAYSPYDILSDYKRSKDRRVMTVAAADCSDLKGKMAVKILRWVDIFVLQPVQNTSGGNDFYAELIGPAEADGGASGFQQFGVGKAVLIR